MNWEFIRNIIIGVNIKEHNYYQSKYDRIRGSSDKEIFYEARRVFNFYQRKRRLPYVRSKYFDKQKVFLSMFWKHLNDKSPPDRRRRIVYLRAAIDVMINSRIEPESFIVNSIVYYRFYGETKGGEKFVSQIMKDKKANRYFMSCFPEK